MSDALLRWSNITDVMLWTGVILAVAMAAAVVIERLAFAYHVIRSARIERQYQPLVQRALAGDPTAERELVTGPARNRLDILALLIDPLIEDRDPGRIARTRAIVQSILAPVAGQYLQSRWWWRRAVALRASGLLKMEDRTAVMIAALDDRDPDVRAAALDALADLRNPASLQAIVVRLQDPSLHRGRRAAALAAFGDQSEPFVLDLASVDPAHRLNYARALRICGTARARPVLCEWTRDSRIEVRAAAFDALAHVGLDDRAATLAIAALDGDEMPVRASAAFALRGWLGVGDAAPHLARHLEDKWMVAVNAARSLRSMGEAGRAALQACTARPGMAGALARQMLWEEGVR